MTSRHFTLHAKRGRGLATEHWQLEKLQELQKELGEAREKIGKLEEDNKALMCSVAVYRVRWINAAREAELLSRYRPDNAPCLSQADWMSSSPVRSHGLCLDLSPRNMIADRDTEDSQPNN